MYIDWRVYISIFKSTPFRIGLLNLSGYLLIHPQQSPLFNSFETLVPARVCHYAHLLLRSFQCIFVSVVNTSPSSSASPEHHTLDSLLSCHPELESTIPQDAGPTCVLTCSCLPDLCESLLSLLVAFCSLLLFQPFWIKLASWITFTFVLVCN